MKIPDDLIDGPEGRAAFYDAVVKQCLLSRNDRFDFYQTMRNYYLFGASDEMIGCDYNKIGSTIETLSSFIYSPDNVKFSIHLGTTADPATNLPKVRPLAKDVNDHWRATDTNRLFGMAIPWALTYGCTLFKCVWHYGKQIPQVYLLEPHMFGVYQENISALDQQQAVVHLYSISTAELYAKLEGDSRRERIMARVGYKGGGGQGDVFGEAMSRLVFNTGPGGTGTAGQILKGQGGSIAGGLGGGGSYDYTPRQNEETVTMMELWIWDDDLNDYRTVTIAEPNVVIYDRPNIGIKGMLPFVKLAPEHNLYDYFWDESFVARLVRLQDWRTIRIIEIRDLLGKQVNPPKSLSGFSGIAEEKMLAMNRAGGLISSPIPGSKMDVHAPQVPIDVFREVERIDAMFDDMAGINHVLQGKGESGVRSRGQADLMARLGSARPKRRAINVEESAADLATLMLRMIQQHSKQKFTAEGAQPNGEPLIFIPNQFTTDFEVRVDGHSSSPIFVEDRKNDATHLLEAGAIDRETLLEWFDPPEVQILQAKLKIREAKEAEQAKMAQLQGEGNAKK